MEGIRKGELGGLAVIAAFYALLFHLGITCPIKFVTGVSCPGCGMTRACLSLLHLDATAALHYHPLVWLLPVGLALYLFRGKLPGKAVTYAGVTLCVLFCAVYLFRMLSGCAPEVVAFAPENGLIFRVRAAFAAWLRNIVWH